MPLFTMKIKISESLLSKKSEAKNLCVTASSLGNAEVAFFKYLFRNELANVDSDTLKKLEEISDYSDQFADLVETVKNLGAENVAPQVFGFNTVRASDVLDLDRAKIVVHQAKGKKRKLIIAGIPVVISEVQCISNFKYSRLKKTVVNINWYNQHIQ